MNPPHRLSPERAVSVEPPRIMVAFPDGSQKDLAELVAPMVNDHIRDLEREVIRLKAEVAAFESRERERRRADVGLLEAERDRIRRELRSVNEDRRTLSVACKRLEEKVVRYEGRANFDPWAVGVACGQWFVGLGLVDSRFANIEVE